MVVVCVGSGVCVCLGGGGVDGDGEPLLENIIALLRQEYFSHSLSLPPSRLLSVSVAPSLLLSLALSFVSV